MTAQDDAGSAPMRGSQPVITISNSDEAALRIIVRQQRSEIERLKDAIRRLADQDATLSVCGGNVTVQVDATLTDAEREAIRFAAVLYGQGGREADAETLRGLLERTK